MFNSNNGVSLADIAAVTGNNRNTGFLNGEGGGIWALIILWALFGGYGGFGFGGYGAAGAAVGTSAAETASIQRALDTQDLSRHINQIGDGIASLGYDQLARMDALSTQISGATNNIQQYINTSNIQNMQSFNALGQGQSQIRYDLATDTCTLKTAINDAAQVIMQNDNANYRSLHDEIVNNRIEDLKTQVANQAATIRDLNLTASQQAQNATILAGVQAMLNNQGCCNNSCCNYNC